MIIEDLNLQDDPKGIEFGKIPQGTIFRGKSGYLPNSIYIKVDILLVYELFSNDTWNINSFKDIIYQYQELNAKLTIQNKI